MHRKSEKTGRNDLQNIDKDPDNGTDEFELYYGESAVDEPENEMLKPLGPLSRRPSFASAIPFFIIAILFILFTYALKDSSFSDYLWASRKTVLTEHQYWRIFTAVFTHGDAEHLLSNIPLLFFFGLFLYEYFGFFLFPVLSLLIGASANFCTLYFYPDTVQLIGGSGMVYGMVSLWLVLYIYHDTTHTIPSRIFRSTGFALIILFPTAYDPGTSYLAHAAGFVIGILSALIILPFVKVKIRTPHNQGNNTPL